MKIGGCASENRSACAKLRAIHYTRKCHLNVWKSNDGAAR